MRVNQQEIDILRGLGEKYMRYATLSAQKEKMEMWKKLNSAKAERPMVIIDQIPWWELEVVIPDVLKPQVADPFWQGVERWLRHKIFAWENFPVDMVLEPYITIPAAIVNTGYGITPDAHLIHGMEGSHAPSQHYTCLLNDMEDVAKIQDVRILKDDNQSAINIQEAEAIFGKEAVKLSHGVQFYLGLWDTLAMLMSVEQIYFDFADRPEFLHALMRRLTDANLAGIKAVNELSAYNEIQQDCHCSYTYTDNLLPDFGAGKGRTTQNGWACGLAQVFTSLSPDSFAEFEVPYIAELAQHFGHMYYGCCDRLDDRLDAVRKIPNVRKVSCSPWSDRDKFAEKLGSDLIMSNKPTPAFLAGDDFNEDIVRKDLEHTCRVAKENGLSLELVLKDISTENSDINRVKRWNEIAMEVAEGN